MRKSAIPRLPLLMAIFLLALGLRLGYFALVQAGPLGNLDSLEYEDLARELSQHRAYRSPARVGLGGFPLDLQRPPGYPVFLALVNSSATISRTRTAVVQCLLSACFAAFLAMMVGFLTSEFTGFLAGVLYAMDWATIVHTPMLAAETLLTVLLGAAVLFYAIALAKHRSFPAMIAGLLLGLAVLVKPVAQVAFLGFLVGWALQRRRRSVLLLFVISYLVIVVPWMVRNYRRHGLYTVSTISIVNIYFYTAQASAHPHSVRDVAGSGLTRDLERINTQWTRAPLFPFERKKWMENQAWPLIRRYWPQVLRQAAIGLTRTCFGTGFVTVADSMPHPPSRLMRILLAVLPLLQVLPLWTLAAAGALCGNGSAGLNRAVQTMLVACAVFLLLPAASSIGQSRFRVPAIPALSVLAATGVQQLRIRFRSAG